MEFTVPKCRLDNMTSYTYVTVYLFIVTITGICNACMCSICYTINGNYLGLVWYDGGVV